jgi:hypothetical protein
VRIDEAGTFNQWELAATGSAGTDGVFNFAIRDAFYDLTRFLIDGSGYIGIGTSSPDAKLDVQDGTIRLSNTADAKNYELAYDSNGNHLYIDEFGTGRHFVIANGGNVGIGTSAPLARTHLRDFDLTLTAAALENDDLIVESFDAALGLYSRDDGTWGSAIALKDLQTDGTLNDTWGIARHAFNAGSSLRITYGPSDNYAANSSMMTINSVGNVGIGTTSPTAKLHVAGNICYTGTIGACSDARYKTNVRPIARALDCVEKIRPVSFDWKRDEFPDRQFSDKSQVGLIAQEVREVLPEVVQEGSDGYLSVDYGRLTPVLTQAIQELKAEKDGEIGKLRTENAELRARLDRLERMLTSSATEKGGDR